MKTITGPVSYSQAEGLFKSVAEVRERVGDDLGKLSAVLRGDAESGEPEKPKKKKKLFGQVIIFINSFTYRDGLKSGLVLQSNCQAGPGRARQKILAN